MIESKIKKRNIEHPVPKRATNILWNIMIWGVVCISLHFGRRIFIAERFNVPTESMLPTLEPGDRIWVNKLLYGPRIYKSLNFEAHAPVKCFRLPGLRKIRPGDVICFNYPLGYDRWTVIEFRINYVYCKRVVGTPGDTIGISDGITWNNNYKGIIGVLENQKQIQNTPDSSLWRTTLMGTMPFTRPMWTVKNFGPLYIPKKGVTIELDSITRTIYGPVIEYETGWWPSNEIQSYTFRNDYFFAFGDNSIDSKDSRYFGFIPDDFVIGIVSGKKVKNR